MCTSLVLPRNACNAGVVAVLNQVINASASSNKLVSGLISSLPQEEAVAAPHLAAAVWALFQQACKHEHLLSTSAQHQMWSSQAGDCAC